MLRKASILIFIACAAAGFAAGETSVIAKPVKRGRSEGTAMIPASNVVGNGNITAFVLTGGAIDRKALSGIASVGGQIGIGGIMQLSAGASFINFSELGPVQAHLQMTPPGNDKLRFFGMALVGDLYLSTSIDTVTETSDSSRPFFNPHPLVSAIADLDWLARPKQIPLKTYLMLSLVDNPQILYRYNQLAVKAGAEWKAFRNSVFADAGVSLYMEKRNRINLTGDDMYRQFYVWVKPGGRYRLGERVSVIGSIGVTLFKHLRSNTAIEPGILSLSVNIEAPLWFRETNTEAIRTLVFMEQKDRKRKTADSLAMAKKPEKSSAATGGIDLILEGMEDGSETFDYSKEKEDLARRRMEIQDKMNEIEKILHDLE
jgi:hypothetical protein